MKYGSASLVAWRSRMLGGVVLGALALVPAEAVAGTPMVTHRDPVHKFSLKRPRDWTQVPPEAGQEYVVAKFFDPSDRGDYFETAIEVVRIDKKTPGQGPVTGSGREIPPEVLAQYLPKSVFDLTLSRLIVPQGQKAPDPKGFKEFVSAEKVKGRVWACEMPFQKNNPGATVFANLYAFEKDGVEYGLYFTTTARRRKDYESAFRSIAKSFLFFDKAAGEVESLDVLDGVAISPKRRKQIENGMVKGWGVMVSPKKNYIVIYNKDKNKNRALAKELAERIEKIREQIYEVQFPPAKPITAVSIMRVCKDANEYRAYGGPPGSAGYWSSGTEELVFYDASRSKKVDDDTLAVLYHEAFHQYIYYSVGNVAPHSWFNEGHGDYYAGSKYQGGKFKIAPFRWRIGTVKNAIREGPRAFTMKKDEESGEERKVFDDAKGYTPLADLVRFSQRDYYSYPGVSYAQGWSLVYFLREVVPKNKKYNEKWGHILPTYFDVLQREVNRETPLEQSRPRPEDPEGPDEPEDPTPPAPEGEGGTPDEEPEDGDEDEGEEEGEEEPQDPGLQPIQTGLGSRNALELAVDAAFKGVDLEELEKAWIEAVLKISG